MHLRQARGTAAKKIVFDTITDKIKYLELKPGEVINENSIAEELGVSRTPVREALILLEQERFVDIYPQRGTYVSKIDLKRISEMLKLRFIVENAIFGELADKKTPVRSKVEKLLMLQEYSVKEKNKIEYIKNDYSFHKELFNIAGYNEIWDIIEKTLKHCTRYRLLGWQSSTEEFELTLKEHHDIINCIESGDKDRLEKILSIHHDDCLKRYKEKVVSEYKEYFVNYEEI